MIFSFGLFALHSLSHALSLHLLTLDCPHRHYPAQQMTQSVFQRMHIPWMLENMLWYFISEVEYTQCYIRFDRQTNRSKLVSGWKLWKFPWAYHHRHRHQYTILSKIDLFSWNNVILSFYVLSWMSGSYLQCIIRTDNLDLVIVKHYHSLHQTAMIWYNLLH